MMKTVDEMIDDILSHEGGFVNDPDDPGGATNHGVTIHTMRRLGVDIDGDGDVDVQDVRLLDEDQAAAIYKDHYFMRPRINELPSELHPTVFDMYVNAGGNAIKILQRMVGAVADGAIGPNTLAKVRAAARQTGAKNLSHSYTIARRDYYYRIGDRRVKSRKYARRRDGGKGGWITRAESFLPPHLHLSHEEHSARVEGW